MWLALDLVCLMERAELMVQNLLPTQLAKGCIFKSCTLSTRLTYWMDPECGLTQVRDPLVCKVSKTVPSIFTHKSCKFMIALTQRASSEFKWCSITCSTDSNLKRGLRFGPRVKVEPRWWRYKRSNCRWSVTLADACRKFDEAYRYYYWLLCYSDGLSNNIQAQLSSSR